jgi:hypothetical protein
LPGRDRERTFAGRRNAEAKTVECRTRARAQSAKNHPNARREMPGSGPGPGRPAEAKENGIWSSERAGPGRAIRRPLSLLSRVREPPPLGFNFIGPWTGPGLALLGRDGLARRCSAVLGRQECSSGMDMVTAWNGIDWIDAVTAFPEPPPHRACRESHGACPEEARRPCPEEARQAFPQAGSRRRACVCGESRSGRIRQLPAVGFVRRREGAWNRNGGWRGWFKMIRAEETTMLQSCCEFPDGLAAGGSAAKL